MAQANSRQDAGGSAEKATAGPETPAQKSISLGVRLTPVNDSDQPLFANYTSVHATPGVAFIDFAFLDPSVPASLPQVEKVPETINGKLVVRVALAPDALQSLARQLNRLMRPPRKPGS